MCEQDLECEELRMEEWNVLEAIYPDWIERDPSSGTIILRVPIDLDEDIAVILVPTNDFPETKSIRGPRICQLPPFIITVELPVNYPLRCPPTILSVEAASGWLTNASDMEPILSQMWMEGEGVLSSWVETIRSGEILQSLGLLNSQTLRIPHPTPSTLGTTLKAHATAYTQSIFASTTFACSICLADLKGAHCVRLEPCAHVFCRPCLADFWGLCIREGDIGRVGCPDPKCVKARKGGGQDDQALAVTETVLSEVLSDDEVERFKRLRAKKIAERDPDMVHCPVPQCQAFVSKAPATPEEIETGYDHLRTCPHCGFAFCELCRKGWHGTIIPCTEAIQALIQEFDALSPADPRRILLYARHGALWLIQHGSISLPPSIIPAAELAAMRREKEVVDEYMKLPVGHPRRILLEMQHGGASLRTRARKKLEERATEAFVREKITTCPGCRVKVEKSDGCNKMICSQCDSYFCFRCGMLLSAIDPYMHFRSSDSPCHMKLMDGLIR